MNWDIIEGKWDQFKGQLKSSFGKLTDDDVKNLSGKRDRVIGKLQERYGVQRDEAERRVDAWIEGLASDEPTKH
ncbi:MAG: CsbD family protein [Myxococcota bacterium]